ncbi:2238_t:CDS:2 [Funneliformis geosporum]|uniref:5811_t:CDS:1 n=1 Tax=Funneliformis geosporum TaxID=1117311 RepID=A0A9W4WMV9_9GLOM|nr:2238_t:CDS:2 [Funneliformis geosporum]CAI2173747.1 5811_t:CDS:2 [Funneliformis geosporum]
MKIKRITKSRRNQISSAPPSSIIQPQQQQESVEQFSSILPQLLDGPEVTEEQKQLILKRVLEVRSKYNAFVERDVCQKVKTILFASDLTEDEARLALSICDDNEQDVLNRLSGKNARKFRNMLKPASHDVANCIEESNSISEEDSDHFDLLENITFPYRLLSTPTTILSLGSYHKSTAAWWSNPGSLYHHPIPINYKAMRVEKNRTFIMSINEDPETGNPRFTVTDQATNATFVGSTPTKPWTTICISYKGSRTTRISGPLYFGFSDPTLQQLLTNMVRESDINEYYYRFVGDGESFCADREWKDEERQLLLTEIRRYCDNMAVGDNKEGINTFPFGLVARNIPNRTGFQCQYEYNQLVTSGHITEFDECPVQSLRVNYDKLVKSLASNGQMKRARKFSGQSQVDSWVKKPVNGPNPWNPLPNMKDSITLEPMNEPAISPDGYVCDYQTWTKILRSPESKDTCPFTKKPLSRRQLIKLTFDNIAEYVDKIRES